MSDTDLPNSDDSMTPDLQAALAAAFGDEAMDWSEETPLVDPAEAGATDDVPDMAALANMLADANSADDPGTALDDLLKKVSSAIDEGNLPEQAAAGGESDEETEQETGVRHVVFEIGDRQFGLPLDGVLEIDRCGKVTSLPRTPHWLRGVTNLRGQILSVTDFRNLVNLQTDRTAVGEKIIVVRSKRHASSTALVVDRVLGIRHLNSERGPVSGLSDRVANFSDGISVTDQATTVLIDPDLLLGCAELSAFASK
jgi:purine-binding chemotaxis protein CheW